MNTRQCDNLCNRFEPGKLLTLTGKPECGALLATESQQSYIELDSKFIPYDPKVVISQRFLREVPQEVSKVIFNYNFNETVVLQTNNSYSVMVTVVTNMKFVKVGMRCQVILSEGDDFIFTDASLTTSGSIGSGSSGAIEVIISPKGGHGNDAVGELG